MFQKARLKLTAWYLLIIMVISLALSVVIYKIQVSEIERIERRQQMRFEERFPRETFPPIFAFEPKIFEEAKQRLIIFLSIINAGILVISGGLSYFLAGKTLKPISEMMEEQNRFITDASHELRTPLTSLKSAFEVYLRNSRPTTKEAKTLASESINEVNKLQSLSDSLLQLAQYQKPNGQLRFEELSLAQVIFEAIRKVSPITRQRKIIIQNNSVEAKIKGNKYNLIDLIVILLDNAIKYSSEGGKIIIDSETTDGSIIISVKDQGVGIDEKDLPHIFDRFFRADSARSKTIASGYGLGLSIAKKIVDNHHGAITVESKLGKGSTFTVRLPIRQKQTSSRFKPSFLD